jgi:aminoglycoside phosphotransferase (APT) family kinase protein
MAVVNDLDLPGIQSRLQDWLLTKLPSARNLTVIDVHMPSATGMSMTTVMFTASWRDDDSTYMVDYVVRVAPSGPGLLRNTSLAREFAVMKTLGEHTAIRVPTVHWYEDDNTVLGSPFIVMDRAHGEVPGDDPPYTVSGWVTQLQPAQRAKIYDGAIEVLHQIHSVDWQSLELGSLDEPQFGPTGIDQQLAHWTDSYHWAANGTRHPTIDAALDWARDNKPIDDIVTLCWGDSRIGNIVYDPVDISVRAVIDWEMATLASPEMDLGWCVFVARLYTEGIGATCLDGLPSRGEIVSRYEELTGRRVRHIDYYEAFAALRLAIVMLRVGQLMISGGALPPGSAMPVNNPVSQLLARLTGCPAPDGPAEWIVGSR